MENTRRIEALIRELDKQREAYLNTFQAVNDLLAHNLAASATGPNLSLGDTLGLPSSSSRTTSELAQSTGLDSSIKASSNSKNTGEDSDDDNQDENLYVQTPLETRTHTEDGLRNHLRSHKWDKYGKKILDGIVGVPARLQESPIIPHRKGPLPDRSHLTDIQVFDVGPDGSPLSIWHHHIRDQHGQAAAIWHAIKDVNPAGRRQAVGRITILREPSPILFGALHHTMNKAFDVDELFRHLVESESSSANLLNRAYEDDERKRRSFVFNFEYFTLIGKDCKPMDWQYADMQEVKEAGQVSITRCSSVVALVLHGPQIKELKSRSRRAGGNRGHVYDPFSSWEVLNLQCYPDLRASLDVHDSTKHYINGPDAFMHTLLGEFRDAHRRFSAITKAISKRVRPSLEFMFDPVLRDRLLFEDNEYTMAKRYFWAHQTLGIVNDSIKAIIDAFEYTFTSQVWEGKHKTLWPLLDENSPRNEYHREKMAARRRDFQHEINGLLKIIDENKSLGKDISSLREELFTGTSIEESRKSVQATETTVQQGHNIKLLTLVSIFFLPLTFVTSVFGMTNMPQKHVYWSFAVVTATVCIPFFVLIATLNTTRGMLFFRSKMGVLRHKIGTFFGWVGRRGTRDPEAGLVPAKSFDSQATGISLKRWSSTQRAAIRRQVSDEPGSREEMGRLGEDSTTFEGPISPTMRSTMTVPVERGGGDGGGASRIAEMMMNERERRRRLTYSEDV